MSLFSCLSRILRTLDIFGLKTEFQIDKKPKFKTASGGFFTIIYLGMIVLLFFSFGGDMINRVNPEITFSQVYQAMPSPMEVSKDHYFFTFGLQNLSTHFIDEEIYTVTLKYGRKNETTYRTEEIWFKPEPCTDSHLPTNPELKEYFKRQAMNISDLYCVPNINETIILQGAWDQPRFGYLRIEIQPCNHSERTCKSDEIIKKTLDKGHFALYENDFLFDLTSYKTPAKAFGRDYFTPSTYSLRKEIYRYFKNNQIVTDDGWISSSLSKSSYFTYDSTDQSFDFLTEFGTMIFFELRTARYADIQSRKYKKTQSVFAEMTGFLQIIFFTLSLVSSPFVKREYFETLTNSIYNFEIDENQSEESEKKKKGRRKKIKKNIENLEQREKFKTILHSNIHLKENIIESEIRKTQNLTASTQNVKKKKDDEKIASFYLRSKETPLKMSLIETIKSKITKDPALEVRKSQRNTGVSSIFSQLDIKHVLKKFSELDKLKMLLLNEDQFHLFEYLPKPVILKDAKIQINYVKEKAGSPMKKSKFSGEIINNHNDIISEVKTVGKALNNIMKKKNNMSDIDKKLLQTIDKDLISLLQEEDSNKPSHIEMASGIQSPMSIDLGKENEFYDKNDEIVDKKEKEINNII